MFKERGFTVTEQGIALSVKSKGGGGGGGRGGGGGGGGGGFEDKIINVLHKVNV